MQYYDIIGDIHGHGDELIKLLQHMGYTETQGCYCHPSRKVIFLGDFIDRGLNLKQHKLVLDIVMSMVKNNHALAVMGNHEFNALAYHTQHNGHYLREHSDKNTHQHQAFLNEYPHEDIQNNNSATQQALDFFMSLPLFLELEGLRIVHACWDNNHIEFIKSVSTKATLNKDLLIKACSDREPAFDAIEVLLKGVEIKLPDGLSFKDKEGNIRTMVRVQWWKKDAESLSDIVLPVSLDIGDVGNNTIPPNLPTYDPDEVPCFIGHYWFNDEIPNVLSDNVACVDYSVAIGGKLVAYRWSGEQKLSSDNFCYVVG